MIIRDQIKLNTYDSRQYVISMDADRYYIINENSYRLICLLMKSKDWEEAYSLFMSDYDGQVSFINFKNLIHDKFGDKGILNHEESIEPPKRGLYLRLRQQVIPPDLAARLASPFKKLFTVLPFEWLFTSLVVCNLVFLIVNISSVSVIESIQFQLWMIIALYATTVFHEMGHIAACVAMGARHGGMGFGFYFIFPVNYAEVNGVWALSKRQRIIVNLAGVYFELIYSTFFIGFYFVFQLSGFLFLALLIFINATRQLYPFFRLDGYWVLSDITGIPNLMKRSEIEVKNVVLDILNRSRKNTDSNLTERTGKKIFLMFYGIMNFFVSFVFIGFVLIEFQNEVLSFPYIVVTSIQNLMAFRLSGVDFSFELFIVLAFYLMIFKYTISISKKYFNKSFHR